MFRKKLSPHKYRKLCEYIDARDQYCLNCGNPNNGTPAHVKRRSQGGNDAPNNIIKLCITCHDDYDHYKIKLPEWIFEMLATEPEEL